jgi:hypothetical protein
VPVAAIGAASPAQDRHRDGVRASHLYRQRRLDLVFGSAASMMASTALTLVSEMPPDGMREAFWICTSVAFTKSLEVVPSAAFSRSHQSFSPPAGG